MTALASVEPQNNAPAVSRAPIGRVDLGTMGFEEMQRVCTALVNAQYFAKDVANVAQCVAKMLIGQELGLTIYEAMTGVRFIEGKLEMAPALMAARINRSSQYSYKVARMDDGAEPTATCEIVFYEGKKRLPEFEMGRSTFSQADAIAAGLTRNATWTKYARNMRFARAMSNGVRWYCGDIFAGGQVYVEGEIEGGPASWIASVDPVPPMSAAGSFAQAATASEQTIEAAAPEDLERTKALEEVMSLSRQLSYTPARVALDLQGVGNDAAALVASYQAKLAQKPVRAGRGAAVQEQAETVKPPVAEPELAKEPVQGASETAAPDAPSTGPAVAKRAVVRASVTRARLAFAGTPWEDREARLLFAEEALGWEKINSFSDLSDNDLKHVLGKLDEQMAIGRMRAAEAAGELPLG